MESIGFKLPLPHLGKLPNDNPANFLTRNNKIFCPQLSRQNIFNMVHLDDLPKICDFSSEFFKNSCPKFLTCQSGTPQTVYFRIHDVASNTPNGLFFNDTSKQQLLLLSIDRPHIGANLAHWRQSLLVFKSV